MNPFPVFPTPLSDRPCIGLLTNSDDAQYKLAQAYVQAVRCSGAVPLVIAPCDAACFDRLLDRVDGLVFTGGGDFTPSMIGAAPIPELDGVNTPRDAFEFPLLQEALRRHLPVLGICRGMQLLNIVMGGTIYQDIYTEYRHDALIHSQKEPRDTAVHEVTIQEDSGLYQLFRQTKVRVNSFHHQAVRDIAPGLRCVGVSPDGVVEAVESSGFEPVIGVQWHPETLLGGADEGPMASLFHWLSAKAEVYRRARRLYQFTVSVDTHCDTPSCFDSADYDLYTGGPDTLVDLRKMQAGGLDAAVMAVYLKQGERNEQGWDAAIRKTRTLLDRIDQEAARYPDKVAVVRTPDELIQAKSAGKKGFFKAIENGYAIGRDLGMIRTYADQGIVYLTLCHNGHNDLCDSASENVPEHHGLSDLGRQAVAALNDCGVLVDLSHASEKTFYDAVDASRLPVVASHSSARALCDHSRNLTDDQIRHLAARGGVMNICLYSPFLASGRPATLRDVVRHINHVRDVAGIAHVGIGSDFDGGGGIIGCEHSGAYFNLYTALLQEGYTEEDIRKITGGNFLRIVHGAQQYACRTFSGCQASSGG